MTYQLVIWLEVHIKIKSPNKLFCQCKNEQNFDTLTPNTHICPICTGQPGALPTLSFEPLFQALVLGKALNCKINQPSTFDRKSYFYPDLPMGYQITQLYHPTNIDGEVTFYIDDEYKIEKTIWIRDAHIETDTAKMIHSNGKALIDFNRAGTPLVEIVTQPDFRDAQEVSAFIKELQKRAKYNNISDADMDKWQMRVDVNISIRKSENDEYGTRVELKNINSTSMIRRAIANEYQRQIDLLENGWTIYQETRKRDDSKWESTAMRSKEDALDYRYFPEPDLPPLQIDQTTLDKLSNINLEIPHQIIKKFKKEYWFHKEYINTLVNNKSILDYFFNILHQDNMLSPKLIAKRISGPISAYLKENYIQITALRFSQNQFIKFLDIAQKWEILDNQLKEVMTEMLNHWTDPEKIIESKWFDTPWFDDSELDRIIQKIIDENPDTVQKYKNWKTSVLWFFVWQVMRETQGKVNPNVVQEEVRKIIQSIK